MLFKDWATKQENLVEHVTSSLEVTELFKLTDERLQDCRLMPDAGISADTCHVNVYEAVLPCAKAVLAASGYRTKSDAVGGHYVMLKAFKLTVDTKDKYVTKLQAARKQRQQVTYQSVGNFSYDKVKELLSIVEKVRSEAEDWIRKNHPHLLNPPKADPPAAVAKPATTPAKK